MKSKSEKFANLRGSNKAEFAQQWTEYQARILRIYHAKLNTGFLPKSRLKAQSALDICHATERN